MIPINQLMKLLQYCTVKTTNTNKLQFVTLGEAANMFAAYRL